MFVALLAALSLLVREPLELIVLHAPSGQQLIYINPVEITSLRAPLPGARQHFAPGARCIIVVTNGSFISVSETCDMVRRLLGEAVP